MLAARPAKRRSVSDSDVIVACTAFYTASQLVSICMRCAYFATIGQSFDWREPIGLQERLEGRSSHNGEFSVMSRSRSQGTEVTIVTGDVLQSLNLNIRAGLQVFRIILIIPAQVWRALYCNTRTQSCNRRKLDASSQIGLTYTN